MTFRTLLLGAVSAAIMAPHALANSPHPMTGPNMIPNAQIGECYQFVRIDAEFETVMQTVIVADGYEIFDVTDPELRPDQVRYVSREAGIRYRVTEPVYETTTEQVQVRPGFVRYEVTPAHTDTVAERILIREARMVWRRGYQEGAHQVRHDPETGEVWCLVEEPAQYETVHRTIVRSPAEVREVRVDPQFATIEREVLVRPATVEEIPIAPEHDTYTVHRLTQEGRVSSRMVERRTQQIARHNLVSGERFEWRLVDCNTIDIPAHPAGNPTSSNLHSNAGAATSRIRRATDGPDPYADHDYEAQNSIPVASANLHPGAPQRRRSRR